MSTMHQTAVDDFMRLAENRNGNESEFLQAVREVAEKVIPFIAANPEYKKAKILERMIEPERVVMFRVPWVDDSGEYQVNRGYRVQMNSSIGPYKGGLRFHPSVNLSILKFLAFEQVFKNSLTTLPMGGGKGGSDFDPKGKSDNEVMRFCQSFMTELSKYIGSEWDVPAGDIGVGGREIGYMYGQYKRQKNEFVGVLTGKGQEYGGSRIRPEATGYGTLYFAQEMMRANGSTLEGKTGVISGSGNVAQYAAEKMLHMGGKVLSMSDSKGTLYDASGIDREKLDFIFDLKQNRRGSLIEYLGKYPNAEYREGQTPWDIPCDVAFPCATQNELNKSDAKTLVENGCKLVSEGANMPCTIEAIEVFQTNGVLYAPGKASNAGGVAVSGLEMAQNAMHSRWLSEEVDGKLLEIMKSIHQQCVEYGTRPDGSVDYVQGANIAGFVRVADAMLQQGHV
ncbi:MAG: NADP-specific glutamate dehydrogenase [Bacteroidia bacterium]